MPKTRFKLRMNVTEQRRLNAEDCVESVERADEGKI